MRYKPRYFQILYPLVSLVAVTQRAPLACNATVMMFCHISLEARKKKLPSTLGDVLYSLYRKRPHHEIILMNFFPRLQT